MKVFPKLNIGLRVLRKRSDGYHDLETVFVPCDAFSDELDIEEADSFSIRIDRCDWNPESDLTARAYRLLKDEFDLPPVRIRLLKGIPVGAGLGGGSSDASCALKMLNSMFSLGLDSAALSERAAKLGSDCPFFIYGRPMVGEGRGEMLKPFDLDLSAFRIEVGIPDGVHVSTREAYSGVRPRYVEGETAVPLRSLPELLSEPVENWRETVENDFEPSVFALHPEIAALKDEFYSRGAVYSSMSGSGSAVYGLFRK